MENPSPISALEALSTTRAIRRYTDEHIPTDVLNQILWFASRAPSGSNRQPFRFLAVTDGEVADKVKSLLGDSFRTGWAAKLKSDGYEAGSGQIQIPRSRAKRRRCSITWTTLSKYPSSFSRAS